MPNLKDILLEKSTDVAKDYASQGLSLIAVIKWSIIAIASSIVLGICYAIFS